MMMMTMKVNRWLGTTGTATFYTRNVILDVEHTIVDYISDVAAAIRSSPMSACSNSSTLHSRSTAQS